MAAFDAWAIKHPLLSAVIERVVQAFLLLLTLFVLAGCTTVSPETVTVEVPVAVRAAPPVELTAPLAAPAPVFVAPADAQATSALTPEGERRLRQLLHELLTRVRAWAAWAEISPSSPGDSPDHAR